MKIVDLFTYGDKQYTRDEFAKLMKKMVFQTKSDSRLSAVMRMIEGNYILDLGCQVGILSKALADEGKNVLGVDSLQVEIDKANLFNPAKTLRYECGDIFKMILPNNEFDSIVFLEVLEHVNDPTKYLNEFLRILKPGGSLIISTPNALSYINILYNILFFFRRKRIEYVQSLPSEQKNTGTQLDHIYSWDFRTLLRYLLRSGFEYSDHQFAGAYPFGIRICGHRINIFGKKEIRFLLPVLRPYLTTLIVKVKKPCRK